MSVRAEVHSRVKAQATLQIQCSAGACRWLLDCDAKHAHRARVSCVCHAEGSGDLCVITWDLTRSCAWLYPSLQARVTLTFPHPAHFLLCPSYVFPCHCPVSSLTRSSR